MYYISKNKVYAKNSNGFLEVKLTKNEENEVTITSLKSTDSIDVEYVCTLEEAVAKYANVEEQKEEVKEEKPKTEKRILKK